MQPSNPKLVSPTTRPVIRFTLQREGRIRDLVMFDLAIDSKLRGCDLVQLRIGQFVINGTAWHRATIVQQKTGKPVRFELTEQTRDSLIAWLTHLEVGCRISCFPARRTPSVTSARGSMHAW